MNNKKLYFTYFLYKNLPLSVKVFECGGHKNANSFPVCSPDHQVFVWILSSFRDVKCVAHLQCVK